MQKATLLPLLTQTTIYLLTGNSMPNKTASLLRKKVFHQIFFFNGRVRLCQTSVIIVIVASAIFKNIDGIKKVFDYLETCLREYDANLYKKHYKQIVNFKDRYHRGLEIRVSNISKLTTFVLSSLICFLIFSYLFDHGVVSS